MNLLNHFEINTLNNQGIDILFEIFKRDFIDSRTYLTNGTNSYQINVNETNVCPCPYGNGEKPEKFWHVITRDKNNSQKSNNPCPDEHEKKRVYDKARAKRIHWIKEIIDNWLSNNDIVFFYQTRGTRQNNLIIWHKKEKFIVIVRKISNTSTRYLVSSYILHDSEEYRYEKQLKNYIKNSPTGEEWF